MNEKTAKQLVNQWRFDIMKSRCPHGGMVPNVQVDRETGRQTSNGQDSHETSRQTGCSKCLGNKCHHDKLLLECEECKGTILCQHGDKLSECRRCRNGGQLQSSDLIWFFLLLDSSDLCQFCEMTQGVGIVSLNNRRNLDLLFQNHADADHNEQPEQDQMKYERQNIAKSKSLEYLMQVKCKAKLNFFHCSQMTEYPACLAGRQIQSTGIQCTWAVTTTGPQLSRMSRICLGSASACKGL